MTNKYYVYELIDPRNNETIYIGKGHDRRIKHHIANARSNNIKCNRNPYLYNKLKKILASGYSDVKYNKIEEDMDEITAYALEAAYIEYYRENYPNQICNISAGGIANSDHLKGIPRPQYVKDILSQKAKSNQSAIDRSNDAVARRNGYKTYSEYRQALDERDENKKLLIQVIKDERNRIKSEMKQERIKSNLLTKQKELNDKYIKYNVKIVDKLSNTYIRSCSVCGCNMQYKNYLSMYASFFTNDKCRVCAAIIGAS